MSLEGNLTTDAVPGAPRKNIIPPELPREWNDKEKENTEEEKLNAEIKSVRKIVDDTPKFNCNKNSTKTPKSEKASKKSAGTKIVVVNSNGVHFGAVNNFNYYSNENNSKRSEEPIVLTKEIKAILNSESEISSEHIDTVSTHLGAGWREVGLELGYSCGQLDNFYEDNKSVGNKEVVYQMLLDWKRLKDDEACVGVLATILWTLGHKIVVKKLLK